MLINVIDNLVRNVVADALAPLPEEADLGRGDVVLDELWNDTDVVSELLQAHKRIVWAMLVEFTSFAEIIHLPISVPLRSRIKAP